LTAACFVLGGAAKASDNVNWRWKSPFQPCNGDCAFTFYAGPSVQTNVQNIFFHGIPPWSWKLDKGGIVAGAASRRIATVFNVFDIEAEIGIGQRFGNMHETEFWEAIYVRYTDFPWNKWLYTTFAMSTGFNYATGISDFEKVVGQLDPPGGTHIMHFWSPEITFALPDRKNLQLVFRLHHRSGFYGLVSGAFSGASYLTVGLRFWF